MINCIIVDADKASRKKVEVLISQISHLNLVKACGTLKDAAGILSKQPVDILFLDIPDASQADISIPENPAHERPKIIITSDVREVAKYAFDMEAVDFILKPITVPRVVKALARALIINSNHEKEIVKSNSSLFVKSKQQYVRLELDNIFLVEALADYVNIHTADKRYTIHATMKALENKLPEADFIRVHKSYIVRLDHIQQVKRATLSVEKKIVPVSNTYRKELLKRLKII